MAKSKAKSKAGHPPKIDNDVLAELEALFLVNASDEEACVKVGIHPSTLYRYQEKNPEYCERKKALKKMPNLKAKIVLDKCLDNNDKDVAKYVLDRTDKEYSVKGQLEVTEIRPTIVITPDLKEDHDKMKDM